MPKTARIARRVLAPVLLMAALCAVSWQVAAASGAPAGGSRTAVAFVHTDGAPCASCNGGT